MIIVNGNYCSLTTNNFPDLQVGGHPAPEIKNFLTANLIRKEIMSPRPPTMLSTNKRTLFAVERHHILPDYTLLQNEKYKLQCTKWPAPERRNVNCWA
jgi:hypothetical protein